MAHGSKKIYHRRASALHASLRTRFRAQRAVRQARPRPLRRRAVVWLARTPEGRLRVAHGRQQPSLARPGPPARTWLRCNQRASRRPCACTYSAACSATRTAANSPSPFTAQEFTLPLALRLGSFGNSSLCDADATRLGRLQRRCASGLASACKNRSTRLLRALVVSSVAARRMALATRAHTSAGGAASGAEQSYSRPQPRGVQESSALSEVRLCALKQSARARVYGRSHACQPGVRERSVRAKHEHGLYSAARHGVGHP